MRGRPAAAIAVICLGIGCAVPSGAEAAPVTFAFTGAVTQTMFDPNDPSGGDIRSGTAFTGNYTFESTAPDLVADGGTGSYAASGAPYGFAVNFGPGHDIATSDALSVGLFHNPAGSDGYAVLACFDGFTCPSIMLELYLLDFDGSSFTSDALPLDTFSFGAFEVATFALRGIIDGNQVEILGQLDSLTCADGCVSPQPQPVPEPGTLMLLSPALAWIGGLRRRARTAVQAMKTQAMRMIAARIKLARMKVPAVVAMVCAIMLSGFATNAFAVDGTILIDQARALAGNIAPGDSPGFPVTISRPGSYRLSSNLDVPAGAAGIVLFTSGVTIDLNGFQIKGGGDGTGIGALQARQAIVVRNGTVTNFERGIDIKGLGNEVRDVIAFGNTGIGIELGPGATVAGTRAFSNGAGISVQGGSILSDNAVLFNNGFGLRAKAGSVIRGNSSTSNGEGIEVTCPALVIGNAFLNGQGGLEGIGEIGPFCTSLDNNAAVP